MTLSHGFARGQVYVLGRLPSGRIVGGCRFDLSRRVSVAELANFFKPMVCDLLDVSMQNHLQVLGAVTQYKFRP